jgi:NAD(P)-dependent dehydrogenase (short-subunit alcohol dehydrogenase family)
MTNHPFSLSGKTILVTGGSSGIGRAIAIACAQMGGMVIITGRNIEQLQVTLSLMEGNNHRFIPADINSNVELDNLVSALPELDGFVSNAGINKQMLCQFIKESDMKAIMDTNLFSPIQLTKKLLKGKKFKDEASIIFMSSISAIHSTIAYSMYCSSKSALISYSKVLALELAAKKIRVNNILPGMVLTNITNKSSLTSDEYEKEEKKYPLGRYGTPEEIAYAAVFLLSDQTRWMTGTDLVIDGGRTLI